MKINLGLFSIEFTRNRFTPIDNISQAWKFWTIRLSVLCGVLFGFLAAVPDSILWAWQALPEEMKVLIPQQYVAIITAVLFILNIILRLAKQKEDKND